MLALLVGSAAVAAELPRRTYLGLQFDLRDRSAPGLLVSAVLPQSTAELAGMRAGDRLTSVGRIGSLEKFDDLRRELAQTPAGQRILLRWYRGRVATRVRPPLGVLPPEVVPDSLVRYETVLLDGIRQRLIVSEPVAGADAIIFYIQGLACSSQDFWLNRESTSKQLIDGWAEAGFATARLEKRGMGDSEGGECGSLSFEDERRGLVAGLARLAELGFRDRIFIFGHSLGGVMAPLVSNNDVAGIMVFGTVAVPWYDYMMENFERQDRLAGRLPEEIETRQTLRADFQQGLLFEGLSPRALIKRSPAAARLEDVQLADDAHYYGRSVEFFEQLAAVDPDRNWRRVWQPVLALHGQYDWVSSRADHERIARLTGGKFLSIGGLDHGFLHYPSLEQSFVSRGTGEFDPTLIEATVAWIRANLVLERGEIKASPEPTDA